jgi:hypothetical protein
MKAMRQKLPTWEATMHEFPQGDERNDTDNVGGKMSICSLPVPKWR